MSLNELNINRKKVWLNPRVNNISIDNNIILPNLNPGVESSLGIDTNGVIISLSPAPSGILPVSGGGTGSGTALVGGKFMITKITPDQIIEGTSATNPSFNSISVSNNNHSTTIQTDATTSQTMTFPDVASDGHIVVTNAIQSMANKTLVLPVISSPTITGTTNLFNIATGQLLQTDGSSNIVGNNSVAQTVTFSSVRLISTGSTNIGALNFYSTLDISDTGVSGPWTANKTFTYTIQRLNKVASIIWNSASYVVDGAPSLINFSTVIPAEFRPNSNIVVPLSALENSNVVTGYVTIAASTGVMVLFNNNAGTGLFSAGSCGILAQSISWMVS